MGFVAPLVKPPEARTPIAERTYWEEIARRYHPAGGRRISRLYSNAAHSALLERWLAGAAVGSALKTDLFDEACGAGLAPLLTRRARRVVGIDLARRTVAAAKQNHPAIEAIEADVRALPFREASFDLVLSNSTLDHFATRGEIATSLSELQRVLRPGGRLIATLDNPRHPLVALRRACPGLWRRIGIVPYEVGESFASRELRDAVERARLRVLDEGAILHFPRFPAELLAAAIGGTGPEGPLALTRSLMRFERLGRWPTRFVTGQFVAVLATRD